MRAKLKKVASEHRWKLGIAAGVSAGILALVAAGKLNGADALKVIGQIVLALF